MKKPLLILSSVIGLITASVAQPTLTGALNNPIVGDVFVIQNTNSVSPGSAGASQTWNLSSMVMSSTSSYTILNSASTPSGSSFPSANVAAFDGTNYAYYETSASQWLNRGVVASGIVFSYTNAEVMANYPFTYGSSVVDAWGCNWTTGSINFARYGTSTITADGYGTVTTPAGTYANVLRVHVIQSYKDSAIGFPIMINYLNDEYLWYKPGTHYALASTFTLTSSSSTSTGGFYLNSIVSTIGENMNLANSLKVFPNPAVNDMNIKLESDIAVEGELALYSVTGQKVISRGVKIVSGSNEFNLDVTDLSSGCYYFQLKNGEAVLKNEKVLISK